VLISAHTTQYLRPRHCGTFVPSCTVRMLCGRPESLETTSAVHVLPISGTASNSVKHPESRISRQLPENNAEIDFPGLAVNPPEKTILKIDSKRRFSTGDSPRCAVALLFCPRFGFEITNLLSCQFTNFPYLLCFQLQPVTPALSK
jgi:hypothetical protein